MLYLKYTLKNLVNVFNAISKTYPRKPSDYFNNISKTHSKKLVITSTLYIKHVLKNLTSTLYPKHISKKP